MKACLVSCATAALHQVNILVGFCLGISSKEESSWIMQMRKLLMMFFGPIRKDCFVTLNLFTYFSDTLTCGTKAYFSTCHEGRNTKNNEEAN